VVKNGASRVVDGSTAAALGQNPSLPTRQRSVLSDCYSAALPGGIGEASCTSKRVEDSTFDEFRKVKKQLYCWLVGYLVPYATYVTGAP
jgi:hypothetical protein